MEHPHSGFSDTVSSLAQFDSNKCASNLQWLLNLPGLCATWRSFQLVPLRRSVELGHSYNPLETRALKAERGTMQLLIKARCTLLADQVRNSKFLKTWVALSSLVLFGFSRSY